MIPRDTVLNTLSRIHNRMPAPFAHLRDAMTHAFANVLGPLHRMTMRHIMRHLFAAMPDVLPAMTVTGLQIRPRLLHVRAGRPRLHTQSIPRLRPQLSVFIQILLLLKLPQRRLGLRTIFPVNVARIKPLILQSLLRGPNIIRALCMQHHSHKQQGTKYNRAHFDISCLAT